MENTTIAAISTPLGNGGIGIVRLSGPQAIAVAQKVFRPMGTRKIEELAGYSGCLGRIWDETGDIDEAICTVYRAPRSYTGEDVVELSCHGGAWVVQAVLRRCLACGAQAAQAGEFTKRAFLNGKMNLTQAEAVMDLIHAQGQAALRAALAARDGVLAGEIDRLAQALLAQSAHLAAWADYPEDEIEAVDTPALSAALRDILCRLEALLQTYDQGKILREGIRTVIVGKPNVGKSTLMNVLAGAQRSIVTDIPGTTRDVVEESVRLGDYVLRIADTAGLRETADPVEKMGVERARRELAQADLVLAVFDSSQPLEAADRVLLQSLQGRACIAVVNKADCPPLLEMAELRQHMAHVVSVSALWGEGRRELEIEVATVLGLDRLDPSAGIVANERQRDCLQKARASLLEAAGALEAGVTLDAVNVCVDFALDALLSLSGKRASDEVVEAVFAQFCVGK